MAKTIDRYVFKELLGPFFLGLAVFTFILLIVRILKLVDLVVNRGVPVLQILEVFSYILPAFLEVTVPMALLLAVLVGFGRLSADSEIVAMKASGLSLYQLARPVFLFTAFVCLATLVLSLYARPWGNTALKAELYEVAKNRASVGLREGIFNADFPGLVIYVEEIVPPGNVFNGVIISDSRDRRERLTAFARRGVLVNNETAKKLTLSLLDGRIESTTPDERAFHETEFSIYDINLDWGEAVANLEPEKKDSKEMTLPELWAAVAANHRDGRPAYVELVEIHRKFAIPFACLVFAAVGMPLGIRSSRGVRSRGFSVSLVLIFVYYMLLTLGEDLGERGDLAPALAMWLPNLAFSLGGIALFVAAARETAFPTLGAIAGRLALVRGRPRPVSERRAEQ